jgi:GNAT superfamily N-acetyltransferase
LRIGGLGVPFEKTSLKRRPDLEDQAHRLAGEGWPAFLLHGDITHWEKLFDEFADYQILFHDPAGSVVSVGHTVPFLWDGTPDDLPDRMADLMDRAVADRRGGREPNALSALAAIVSPDHRRRGLSTEVLRAMRSLAQENDLATFVAPVRPTLKGAYPLTPFWRYVRWERSDGSAFDPWLRVHRRLGAEPLKLMPESLTVVGTVAEWEAWTGIVFPESGRYVVPGALQPVVIDRERDLGRYDDPNIWMRHPIH